MILEIRLMLQVNYCVKKKPERSDFVQWRLSRARDNRHTCATHMLESGENIKKIALMLGHRSLKTTGKYLHVASNYLDNMKTPLDDLDLD